MGTDSGSGLLTSNTEIKNSNSNPTDIPVIGTQLSVAPAKPVPIKKQTKMCPVNTLTPR